MSERDPRIDETIARFHATYGEPRTPDPNLFLAELRRALGAWPADVLAKGADEILDRCVYWPRPADIRDVLSRLTRERAQRAAADERQERQNAEARAYVRPSVESRARVEELVQAIIAQQRERADDRRSTLPPAVGVSFEQMQRASPNRFHREPRS